MTFVTARLWRLWHAKIKQLGVHPRNVCSHEGKKTIQLFWLYTLAADKIPSQSNYFLVVTLLHYPVIYELLRPAIIHIYIYVILYYIMLYYILYYIIYYIILYILYIHLIIKIIYISPYLWALYILISQLGGFLSHMATLQIIIPSSQRSVPWTAPWRSAHWRCPSNVTAPPERWPRRNSRGIHHQFFLWIQKSDEP